MFVMKPILQGFFCLSYKKFKRTHRPAFCAGLLVLGKAQNYTAVLKNYCIILRRAKWHIQADVDFF